MKIMFGLALVALSAGVNAQGVPTLDDPTAGTFAHSAKITGESFHDRLVSSRRELRRQMV